MTFFKIINGDYIQSVGTSEKTVFTEIPKTEYDRIREMMAEKPTPPEGCGYRLTNAMTWELYKLPVPDPDPDPELTDSEALEIIVNGGADNA